MADAGRADLSRIGVGSLVLSAQGMKSEHRREHATLQVRCCLYMQQRTDAFTHTGLTLGVRVANQGCVVPA